MEEGLLLAFALWGQVSHYLSSLPTVTECGTEQTLSPHLCFRDLNLGLCWQLTPLSGEEVEVNWAREGCFLEAVLGCFARVNRKHYIGQRTLLVYTCVHTCVCTCVYVCTCVHVYMCMCVYVVILEIMLNIYTTYYFIVFWCKLDTVK